MYEWGKMGNKTGITSYSWTVWYDYWLIIDYVSEEFAVNGFLNDFFSTSCQWEFSFLKS